jgi:hypothetical protein
MDVEHVAVACLGLADGTSAGELDGAWLVSYDPAGCDGCGDGTWSRDPAEAARFTPQEWAELWTASPENRPLRPDGKPNRPITMFSLTIVPAYPGRLPSILPAGPDGRPPMGDTEFVAHVYELAAQDAKRPPAPRPAPPPPPAEPVNLADEMRAMGLL